MDANEYQHKASGTAVYPGRLSPHGVMYCALKLNGEAGELAEHVGKAMRDDGYGQPQDYARGVLREGERPVPTEAKPMHASGLTVERHTLIIKEIGDVAWYLAALSDELGVNLADVLQANLDKLASRRQRGTLGGSGDNR